MPLFGGGANHYLPAAHGRLGRESGRELKINRAFWQETDVLDTP